MLIKFLKLFFIFLFGVFFIPNISHAITLLSDDFSGTVINQSKWNMVGGTEGVDYIQNNNINVRNSSTNGQAPGNVTSLQSTSSFSKEDNLTISANVTTTTGASFLGYGNFSAGTYYFVRIGSSGNYWGYIFKNGAYYTNNLSCGSYTAGAKVSLKITSDSFQVLKNNAVQCTISVDGTAPVMSSHPVFLKGSTTGSFFDNIEVVNDATAPATTIPDPISNLSAGQWGNNASTLTFTPPSNGGDPITDYIVDYRILGDTTWINFNDGVSTSNSINVTGLINGTTYEFRVRAVNGVGTANDSNIASVTVSAPQVPSTPIAPVATTILNINGSKASIAFSAPAANGSAITSYTVTSSPGGLTQNVASSPATFTNLTNGVSYTFTVTATNGVGTSSSSAASNSITPTAFSAGKISWTERTNSGVRDWRDVAMSSDGVKLVAANSAGYIYTSSDSGSTWTEQTTSGARNWYAVASSADGVKLVAVNYGGYIYTSTDSGVNWTSRTDSGQRQWNDVSSSSDGVYLVAITDTNTVYYSTNSGANWSLSLTDTRNWQALTSSADGSIAYIGSSTGVSNFVDRSNDYGAGFANNINLTTSKNWSTLSTSSDGVKVFGGTGGEYIYTSSDSGANWIERSSSGSRTWNGIANSSNGDIVLAGADKVLISVDGGVNWITETSTASWKSVDISDDGLKVVAVPENGYIYTGIVDITAPTITNVSSDKTNASYTVGEVIDIDVTFSEAVTSTGNVTVTLETGTTDRNCNFTITNSTTGTCNYTVQVGDSTSDLTIKTISGTITDQYLNTMTDFVPVTNLASNKAIVIDAISPIISEITPIVTPATDTTPSYTFTTNEAGTITYGGSCSSATTVATLGSNTITFSALVDGTYSDCTVTVTDSVTNASNTLAVTTFVIDTTNPSIIQYGATPSNTTAVVTWETNEPSSSIVDYGITNSYENSTLESDTSPRVTSHSVSLSSLVPCATYFLQVRSRDGALNSISNQTFFTTTGCAGNAPILNSNLGIVSDITGGTRQLSTGVAAGIDLNIPAGSVADDANFQIKQLDTSTALLSIGVPSGVARTANNIYDLKALTDVNTAITSFNNPITTTLTYLDSDITGIIESSLLIYRWNGSVWNPLSDCIVDSVLNTITCTTTNFSVFGLFGTSNVVASSSLPGGAVSVSFLQQLSDRLRNEQNTEIKIEEKICGNLPPLSKNLKLNIKDKNVKILQQILNCKGYIISTFGAGSLGKETTFFGTKTKDIVIKFQKDNRLAPDGIVGPIFRKILNK